MAKSMIKNLPTPCHQLLDIASGQWMLPLQRLKSALILNQLLQWIYRKYVRCWFE